MWDVGWCGMWVVCALSSKAWTRGDGRVLELGKSKVMAQVMVAEKT